MPKPLEIPWDQIVLRHNKGELLTKLAKEFNVDYRTLHRRKQREGWSRKKIHKMAEEWMAVLEPAINLREQFIQKGSKMALKGLDKLEPMMDDVQGIKQLGMAAAVGESLVRMAKPLMGLDAQQPPNQIQVNFLSEVPFSENYRLPAGTIIEPSE